MLLSIIIPIYNLESCIEECLNSITTQVVDTSDIEIIAVNDGSTDNTKYILDQMASIYTNIKVVHQPNMGVSGARNAGIAVCSGKFVVFLDGDDKFEELALSKLLEVLMSNDSKDMFIFGFKSIDEKGKCLYQTNFGYDSANEQFELNAYFRNKGENNPSAETNRAWGIAYKREILSKLIDPFPLNVPYLEDAAFLCKYFFYMRSYSFHNFTLVIKIRRLGSAINSDLFYSKNAINGFTEVIKDLNHFKELDKFNFVKSFDREVHLNQTLIKFSTLRVIAAVNAKSYELLRYVVKTVNKEKVRFTVAGVRYPFTLWGWSYRFSVFLFIIIYFIESRFRYLISKVK
jgi:glycosyltransferase involved in cell wall biosynthesis